MALITLHGNPCNTNGSLPNVGDSAPEFNLTDAELTDVKLSNFAGKKKLLNIVPSLDTPTCAISTQKFSEAVGERADAILMVISADLPFAQKRFCSANGTDNVQTLSTFRSSFAKDYGIEIIDGPLSGLTGRAVVVLDENDKVIYTQLVAEIGEEPDYEKALQIL